MKNLDQIKKVVKKTLTKPLGKVSITKIDVVDGVDADGDDILRISVIYDGGPEDLNPEKLLGITRILRDELDTIGEQAYPLVSFISKTEYEIYKEE